MEAITVRKMGFEFPPDLELIFIRDEPGLSYTFVGTWMLLPYLEPYLIRSMREALPQIASPELRAEVQGFCAQEGQHYREHARANDAIRTRKPGFAKLAEIEREIAAEYESFTRDRSLLWNLAYAEGFEALTAAQASTQFDERVFERDLMDACAGHARRGRRAGRQLPENLRRFLSLDSPGKSSGDCTIQRWCS